MSLSQLSYSGFEIAEGDLCAVGWVLWGGIEKQGATHHGQRMAMGWTEGQWEARAMRPWGDWEIDIGAI